MADIQLDMFEVQLGSAILLSFNLDGRNVKVLADAGVKASGYATDHVLQKLDQIFGDGPRHIDLIIGTHYDEDHLRGLVPIIGDRTITIGEAWMPPVADDIANVAVDQPVAASHLLAHKFKGEDGRKALAEYLNAKGRDMAIVASIADDLANADLDSDELYLQGKYLLRDLDAPDTLDDLSVFRQVLGDDDCDHGIEQELEPDPLVEEIIAKVRRSGLGDYWYFRDYGQTEKLVAQAKRLNTDQPNVQAAQLASLLNVRKGVAKDAINAKALHDVVQALDARSIPIRTEMIDDGVPRTFRWSAAYNRFVLAKAPIDGLHFTLLGPSKSLIKKHRDRLPVVDASKVALLFRGEIRSITPSNQLSYIGCFGFLEQVILVSGDAGCVDFKATRNSYHQPLLDAMRPLHVIQVAHHGGNNAHFYRVLDAAKYPEQNEQSYLLLSHAFHDKTRPSDVFHDFILAILGIGDDVKLLFTSEPTRDKVVDYLKAIQPVVGTTAQTGDIRIEFSAGRWDVTKHAVEVL
ncbi:hypothetical protein CSE45_3960 [Citreicella sp. SE45]|nr:hypothetical protein CSE45_3960 [Citreicella sp. SE45]